MTGKHINITIKLLEVQDIAVVTAAFKNSIWNASVSLLERYLAEQERGERTVITAYTDGDFAGYVTIKWRSDYPPFAEKGIPEINDLRVLPAFRRRGVATALVDEAEKQIFKWLPIAGIGVGLYAGYGTAQRMYVLRGYVPDGLGVFYKEQHVKPGQELTVDDDLVLYFTKDRGE